MDKKIVKDYWEEVRQRAWKKAVDRSEIKALVPLLFVLVVAIGLSGIPVAFGWIQYAFLRDNLFANTIAGLAQIIVSIILLLSYYLTVLIEIPPKMHEELGGFIKNPFRLTVYRSKRERKEDEDKWVSLEVKNTSPSENIEECFIKLIDIVDLKTGNSIIEDVQNLTWSGREQNKNVEGKQPLRITADHEAVCDVARTNLSDIWGEKAYYTFWFGSQKLEKGNYLLKIIVYGVFKKHPTNFQYQLSLAFDGYKNIEIGEPILIAKE